MKKKNSYIGLSIVVLIFAILFVPKIHDRLTNGTTVDASRMSNNPNLFKDGKTLKIGEMTTTGKVPDFKFVNQDNDTITNEYYKGKVYVVEFFFSTCPSICPIMNQNMLLVQNEFAKSDKVGIASFSIDPTYDTPEVLKAYAEGYEVTHPHWNFLTGKKAEILKLSNEGFKLYAAENETVDGGFEHSGMFALIDGEGNIRSRIDKNGNPLFYYDGLTEVGVNKLIEDIHKLLK